MIQSSSQIFGGFICFLAVAFLEFSYLKLIMRAHEQPPLSLWGRIKNSHPYNFASGDRKLGFTGLVLAILLGLWNYVSWREAIGYTIFLETILIISWDFLNSRTQTRQSREQPISQIVNNEVIGAQRQSQEPSLREITLPLFYSLLMTVALLFLLSVVLTTISISWEFILPIAVYFVLMVPLSRFTLTVLVPQMIVWTLRWKNCSGNVEDLEEIKPMVGESEAETKEILFEQMGMRKSQEPPDCLNDKEIANANVWRPDWNGLPPIKSPQKACKSSSKKSTGKVRVEGEQCEASPLKVSQFGPLPNPQKKEPPTCLDGTEAELIPNPKSSSKHQQKMKEMDKENIQANY